MTTVAADGESDLAGPLECWCCGGGYQESDLIHLGRHPEVGVCLRCGHFLHKQACAREDALRRSPGSRIRDGLRAGRRTVMDRGWQQRPYIGRPLRWLGRRLP